MNVFIIPSWYPSPAYPSAGIFFKEQAELLAKHRPDWNVAISTWGSHDPKYWIRKSRPLEAILKLSSRRPHRFSEQLLQSNCAELFYPAYTWSRKIRGGNMEGIIRANAQNLERFIVHFGRPDVIHAHVAYPAGFIAQALSKKFNVPYVVTEHMSPFPLPSLKSGLKQLILPPLKSANRVLAVSENLVGELIKKGIQAEKVSNFIDDELFVPKEKARGRFVFLCIARLEAQKDLATLLKATHLLETQGLGFELKIIGTGSQGVWLKRLSKSLKLKNMNWLGERGREEVRSELQHADALVLSSLHENQPVAILEAMACGLPIITTDWAGAKELVSDEVGLISPLENVSELAENMEKIFEKSFSKTGIRGVFEGKFRCERSVSQLEKIYREVIG